MNHNPSVSVLSIYPMTFSFAFVLFDGPSKLIDWGVCYTAASYANRNAKSLSRIYAIIDQYQPDAIVIEDYTEPGSRRSPRIRRLYRSLTYAAQTKSIDVFRIAKVEVKKCFGLVGAKTKYEVAQAVAQQFSEFAHRLPKKRRAWDSQQPAMGLFTSAALSIVFYFHQQLPI